MSPVTPTAPVTPSGPLAPSARPARLSRRRRPSLLGALAIAAIALTGCAAAPGSSAERAPGAAASAPVSSAGFPLTVQNVWGEAVIPEQPQRVVALGYADVALASALDATVVGAVASFGSVSGETTDENLPYVAALPADVTWLNPMEISVEQIAGLAPDVILANAAFTLTEQSYAQLMQVAPVVTYEAGLYQASAEEEALRIGRALGNEAGAERLIAEAEAATAEIRAELPGLAGGSYLYGQARDGVAVMIVDDRNLTAKFLGSLGIRPLPAVAELGGVGAVPGSVDVSLEQAGLFDDAGVLWMTFQSAALRGQFESDPVVAGLSMLPERYFPLGIEAATALQSPNVAAVPWLLDELRPGLAAIDR